MKSKRVRVNFTHEDSKRKKRMVGEEGEISDELQNTDEERVEVIFFDEEMPVFCPKNCVTIL